MVQQILSPSFGLHPGDALAGILGGDGFVCANISASATSTTQPGATPLPTTAAFININVVGSAGNSAVLPFAIQGQFLFVANTTVTSCNIFAQSVGNRSNANALDVIAAAGVAQANATAFALAGNTAAIFFCPSLGIWAAR